jgi:hypothetical protein
VADDPPPLWAILLDDDGGTLAVFAHDGHFLLRVTLPHPDYMGPDVVAERIVTRERFRKLWLKVRGEVPASL